MFRGDAAHLGVYASTAPTLTHVKWRFATRGKIFSSPAVLGGVVYVGSTDGNLYAVRAADGSLAWRFPTHGPVNSSPAVADGLVFFSSLDGNVYAVDANDGRERWHFTTGGERRFTAPGIHGIQPKNEMMADPFDLFLSSPAVSNGVVYIGSGDHNVYALDAASGRLRWQFSTGNVVHASPADRGRHGLHRQLGSQLLCARRQYGHVAVEVPHGRRSQDLQSSRHRGIGRGRSRHRLLWLSRQFLVRSRRTHGAPAMEARRTWELGGRVTGCSQRHRFLHDIRRADVLRPRRRDGSKTIQPRLRRVHVLVAVARSAASPTLERPTGACTVSMPPPGPSSHAFKPTLHSGTWQRIWTRTAISTSTAFLPNRLSVGFTSA